MYPWIHVTQGLAASVCYDDENKDVLIHF